MDSRPDTSGVKYLRWRHCAGCHQLFETAEQATGQKIPLHGTPQPDAQEPEDPLPFKSPVGVFERPA